MSDLQFPVGNLPETGQQLLLGALFTNSQGDKAFVTGNWDFRLFFAITIISLVICVLVWILLGILHFFTITTKFAERVGALIQKLDLFGTFVVDSDTNNPYTTKQRPFAIGTSRGRAGVYVTDIFGALVTIFCGVLVILTIAFALLLYNDYKPLEVGDDVTMQALNSRRSVGFVSLDQGVMSSTISSLLEEVQQTIVFNYTFTIYNYWVRSLPKTHCLS